MLRGRSIIRREGVARCQPSRAWHVPDGARRARQRHPEGSVNLLAVCDRRLRRKSNKRNGRDVPRVKDLATVVVQRLTRCWSTKVRMATTGTRTDRPMCTASRAPAPMSS